MCRPGSQQQQTPDACSLRIQAYRTGSLPPGSTGAHLILELPGPKTFTDLFLSLSSLEGMTRNCTQNCFGKLFWKRFGKLFWKKTIAPPFAEPAEPLIRQISDLPSPPGADLASGPPFWSWWGGGLAGGVPHTMGAKHITEGNVMGGGSNSTS